MTPQCGLDQPVRYMKENIRGGKCRCPGLGMEHDRKLAIEAVVGEAVSFSLDPVICRHLFNTAFELGGRSERHDEALVLFTTTHHVAHNGKGHMHLRSILLRLSV